MAKSFIKDLVSLSCTTCKNHIIKYEFLLRKKPKQDNKIIEIIIYVFIIKM